MPISFRCSQCNQLLRVPETAAGKSARCPKCQALMTVPPASEEGGAPAESPAGAAGGWSPPQPPSSGSASSSAPAGNDPFGFLQQPPAGGSPPQKPPPSGNPFGEAAGASPFGGGKSPFGDAGPGKLNPYASPAGFAPTFAALEGSPVVPQAVTTELILQYAWRLWQIHLGLLLGVTITIMVISWILQIPFSAIQVALEQQKEPEAAFAVSMLGSIISNLVQLFLGIGQAQIALKLARGRPAEFADLFRGGPLFLPVLGASLLFGLMFFFGALLLVIPALILATLLWPYYYLIVDQKTGVIDSFSTAMAIGQLNWPTTLLLAVISFGIMLLGCVALCIGLIFAAPLVTMIWAVAYLMMAGQIPANPLQQHYGA